MGNDGRLEVLLDASCNRSSVTQDLFVNHNVFFCYLLVYANVTTLFLRIYHKSLRMWFLSDNWYLTFLRFDPELFY